MLKEILRYKLDKADVFNGRPCEDDACAHAIALMRLANAKHVSVGQLEESSIMATELFLSGDLASLEEACEYLVAERYLGYDIDEVYIIKSLDPINPASESINDFDRIGCILTNAEGFSEFYCSKEEFEHDLAKHKASKKEYYEKWKDVEFVLYKIV